MQFQIGMGDNRTPSTSPEDATHTRSSSSNGAAARRMSMDVDVDVAVQGDTLEPASGKAKDKPRLACQPCRLVRVSPHMVAFGNGEPAQCIS